MIDTEFECAMRAHQERNSNPAVRGGDGEDLMVAMEVMLRGWRVFEVKIERWEAGAFKECNIETYNVFANDGEESLRIALKEIRTSFPGEIGRLISITQLCVVDLT